MFVFAGVLEKVIWIKVFGICLFKIQLQTMEDLDLYPKLHVQFYKIFMKSTIGSKNYLIPLSQKREEQELNWNYFPSTLFLVSH